MSEPMTADQLMAALIRWGVTVVEHPGWRTNNRAGHGSWGPVNGSMIHHTASTDGPAIVDLCYVGRSDLPGPLCHGVIRKDGTVVLVGNGRANHAGAGALNVYSAVLDEIAIPKPGADTVDGNAHFYGWECVNLGDGNDPWPDAQLEAMVRVQAAVCEFHGWGAQSVIGHLEWTARKIDPRGFTMVSLRALVAKHLAAGPGKSTSTKSEDSMTFSAADVKQLASTDGVFVAPPDATGYSPDPASPDHYWAFGTHVQSTTVKVRNIEKMVAELKETVDGLAGATVAAVVKALGSVQADFVLSDAQVEKLGTVIADRVASDLSGRLQS